MSFFKNLFGKANELKESVEQKEITTKINDLYESIAKGVEELNAKVNSVKELKEKLKALPPPPPPPPPPTPPPPENSDKAMNSSEEDPEKTKQKQEEIIRKQKEEEEKNKVAPPVAKEMSDDAPLAPFAPLAPPAQADSPLPMPGAPTDLTPNPLDFEGGKKRKSRAKGKRATISKNKNETNSGKRTRKNRNSNKESIPESTN
jgi:hypothetical protein